jgi:hypothetical protein
MSGTTTPSSDGGNQLSDSKISQIITLGIIGIFLALLALSVQFSWPKIYVAMFAGAVGGVGHEFAQSGGKIAFYTVNKDGAYLGSLAGIPLGMIASFLVFEGNFSEQTPIILTQSIIAGLALKGVSEAIGGQAIPSLKEQIQILNSYWDDSKTAKITIINTGDIVANVVNIMIDSKPYDVANGYIEPQKSKNIEIPNVPQFDFKTTSIKAITASGKQSTYPSST